MEYEVVLIDATETLIQRPKKSLLRIVQSDKTLGNSTASGIH